MNLISHNCLSGYLYKNHLNERFENPFIWTVIDFNSFIYMIKNWEKINFNNYVLCKDEKWNFYIIIDEHIKIQYVHYKFDKNVSFCDKTGPGTDIRSNKIWEYIIEKYEERVSRMITNNEKPIFCVCNSKTVFNDCKYTNEQLNILRTFNNVFILEGYENNETKDNAKIFFEKFLKIK